MIRTHSTVVASGDREPSGGYCSRADRSEFIRRGAMAMASAASAALSSSVTLVPSCRRCHPQASRASPAPSLFKSRGVHVKCGARQEVSKEKRAITRRQVFSLATFSVLLVSDGVAQAKDIPLFGIRKQLEKAEKAVEKEVKELAKQGEKELEAVTATVEEAVSEIESGASVSGPSPFLQAGGVLGAELVAVLVASTAVNGLLSVPSKNSRGKGR